jgi:hypothetical protein
MSNKVFKEYFAESQVDYVYTLKLAVNEVTDKMMDKLEIALGRYELVSASAFKKTPIQESPLDFPNVRNSPVFISEIKTTYPASRDFLETYISGVLGISEQLVVVYSQNDPRQSTTDMYLRTSAPDFKENYKPVLGEEGYPGDVTNAEAAKMYGKEFNTSFLKELEEVAKNRTIDIIENPLSIPSKIDNSDLPASYDNFNKDADNGKPSIFGREPKNKYTNWNKGA